MRRRTHISEHLRCEMRAVSPDRVGDIIPLLDLKVCGEGVVNGTELVRRKTI